jgi:hypothetical protein
MLRNVTHPIGVILLAAALLAAAVQVQALRERRYPPRAGEDDALAVTSPAAIRRFAGAYAAIGADVYWVRAIQYYGGIKRRLAPGGPGPLDAPEPAVPVPTESTGTTGAYGQLYPMLDVTTSLDPRFNIAYRFGAVFLAEPYPAGAGRPDLAVKLLEKGLRERPDKWEYMQDIGFVHYWYRHDFRAAATWFDKAGQVPGAPWWLKSMAATTLAQGGDRRSSRAMWEAIRQSAEIDWLRSDADRRLAQLRALDDIDALQAIVDAYTRQRGTLPTGWEPVARARGWRGIPVDPAGVPYEITPEGRVLLSKRSTLAPLPQEPQQSHAGAPPAS